MRNKVAKEIRRVSTKLDINYRHAKKLYTRLPSNAKNVHIIQEMFESLPILRNPRRR